MYCILYCYIYIIQCKIYTQRERDYYSTNLSILNISSYTGIETCFEMLISSEHEKLWCYTCYKSPNILDCSEVFRLVPQFNFTIKIIIGGKLVIRIFFLDIYIFCIYQKALTWTFQTSFLSTNQPLWIHKNHNTKNKFKRWFCTQKPDLNAF